MRLIDVDKAKAELLAIAETIPAWPGFFDGIRSGYQSAADRLDTMPVVEERKHGHWIELEPDKYGNFIQFYKLFPKYRYKDDILFIITLISVILGILSIGMVCCFITGVSEYLAYLQNPLEATLNYLITGR